MTYVPRALFASNYTRLPLSTSSFILIYLFISLCVDFDEVQSAMFALCNVDAAQAQEPYSPLEATPSFSWASTPFFFALAKTSSILTITCRSRLSMERIIRGR